MAIQGPMTGIRVLEMGNQVAPATCTRMMADLGAEVIKVENTHGGDTFRAWPRMLGAPIKDDCNPIFDNLNANKKSISIDTKTEEGLAVMEELLKTADIFITNVRTKGLKKMGLDYDSIKTRFPKLVMGQVGAYGSQGPESWKPGYDSTAFWARSGFMSNLTVDRPGESQAYPIALPMGVGDIACAMALMAGCNAALLKARETGVGDYIEIPLYGTAVYMCNLLICGTQFKYQYPRTRYGSTPFGSPFLCKDGRWFLPQIVNLLKDGKAYWEVLGCTDYLEDPAYMERVNFNDLEFNTPVMHRLEPSWRAISPARRSPTSTRFSTTSRPSPTSLSTPWSMRISPARPSARPSAPRTPASPRSTAARCSARIRKNSCVRSAWMTPKSPISRPAASSISMPEFLPPAC